MSELITLNKNSADFESYLLGTFSKNERALPVQSLNVNSTAESVTFKIVPVEKLQIPSIGKCLAKTLKLRSFLFLLTPLFLVLTKNIADNTIRDPISTVLATIGVLLAFVAVNLRNDYMDHIKGVDRILERSGSRAIQNGWITAATVKSMSTGILILSLLCAVPILLAYPDVGWVIAAAAVVGVWAQFTKKNSFKYQIGGEVALFVMLGPLLTVGYQLSMGAHFDIESFWLGCVWGWAVLFVVHLRNFRNILPSSQAGFKNTINWLGFDKARRLLAIWWGLFLVINLIYHYVYAGLYWGFYLSVVLFFVSAGFISKLKAISSSVGGELRQVFKYGFTLFLVTIGLWVFECLWYLTH